MRALPASFLVVILLAVGQAMAGPADVLSEEDAARYTRIFAAQEQGDWAAADHEIAEIEDKVLLGYVLEQRYMHPTAYRSSYPELRRWLSAYADHPSADRIYRLAKRRQGSQGAPRRPSGRRWRQPPEAALHPVLAADYQTNSQPALVDRIERRIRFLCRDDRPTQALNYLNDPRQFNALTAAQTDRARGWIAASYYYNGLLTKAEGIADEAIARSGDHAVLSHWVAGLIDWRRGDHAAAYDHFTDQAAISYQEPTLRAAGAFWAARAALRTGNAADVDHHLEIAADYPLTFYGQLALGQLGRDASIDWSPPVLTTEDLTRLTSRSPRVRRAAALAQVGRTDEAETELQWAHAELPQSEDPALIALAHAAGLPSAELVVSLGSGAADDDQLAHLRAGLFPLPDYTPTGGFRLDRAVLYGLIRQESKFKTGATSRVGARGLMQLMPRTASAVATSGAHSSRKLYDPAYNMQLGQSYVEQLLTRYNGGTRDLFAMALSYNWGPGNYRRWRARNDIDDPLLMIESVPNAEARHFVETVLTNIWVYRDRLGEPAPSRDAVSAGGLPIYQSVSR